MKGIDLNKPIKYLHASLRFFEENEHHIERLSKYDVMLLVFDGILRFTENAEPIEVRAGEYYIQRHNGFQQGPIPSQKPAYLYIHFHADWGEDAGVLPYRGNFSVCLFKDLINKMDLYSRDSYTLTEKYAVFTEILSLLYQHTKPVTQGSKMSAYLEANLHKQISLQQLSDEFNYSKNQIISIFRKEFSSTPICYLNRLRIQKAMHLLESTSESVEAISESCGFRHYSHFFRLFVRHNGISPTDWRKKQRISPQ